MLVEITSEWDERYNKSSKAEPDSHRVVVDVLAVRIENGHFRGSDFDGIFEVADVPDPFDIFDGKLRVQVKVGWFGMKPKSTWSHVTLNGKWQLLRNYSGEVVHNLSAA